MSDFISDDDMKKMEAPSASPDFVSDDEMNQIASPQQSSSLADNAADVAYAGAGAGAGAAVGYGIKEGIAKGADKIAPLLGNLNRNELDFITENRDTYKPLKKMDSPLETMFKQYQDLSGKTRQTAFDAKNAAIASLEGAEAWTPQKYYEVLGQAASNEKFSSPVDPKARAMILAEEAGKAKDKLGKVNPAQIDAQIKAVTQELADTQALGLENSKAAELQAKLDQLAQAKTTTAANAAGMQKELQEKATKRFQKEILRTPNEVLQATPFLAERSLDPQLAPALDKAAAKARGVQSIPMERLAEGILPSLRDNADFKEFGSGFTDKFNTNMSEELRRVIGEENPMFDEQMKRSSKAIDTQKLFEDTGLKWDKDAQRLDLNTNTLMGILSDPDMKADKFKRIEDAVRGAQELGVDVEGIATRSLNAGGGVDADLFLKQLEGARIRDKVINKVASEYSKRKAHQTAGQMLGKALTGSAAGGAVAGAPGAMAGLGAGVGADLFGSRLQEMLALAKSNPAFKTAGRLLPGAGALLGLGLGASSAQAAGFDPAEAAAIGTAEGLNPIPFTDVTEAAKAVRDIPQEELQKASGEVQSYSPGGMPAQAAMVSGEALKGFTKPLQDLGGAVAEGVDSLGTSKANDARSRMEQNLNAFRQLRGGDKSAVVGPEKMNPDQLNALSQEFQAMGGGAAGFADNLAKAARAEDEDARNRILHGLSQQPGFRALMNRRNK